MYTNLSLADASAVDRDFTKLFGDGQQSCYLVDGSTDSNREELRLKHRSGGKSVVPGLQNKSHLVSSVIQVLNPDTGKVHQVVINTTISGLVDGTLIAPSRVADAVAAQKDFLADNLSTFLNGEL